jgi:TldD protein
MLEPVLVREILDVLLESGADAAEVFAQKASSSGLVREALKTSSADSIEEAGVGLRVFAGGGAKFADVDGLDPERLLASARALAAQVPGGRKARCQAFRPLPLRILCPVKVHPLEVPDGPKEALLLAAEELVLGYDARLFGYLGVYRESLAEVLVANSEGLWAQDARAAVTLYHQAAARRDGYARSGARVLSSARGFELFDGDEPQDFARDAARVALLQLDADPATEGEIPVVIASKAGGVLIHEAVGHLLEGDAIVRGDSPYAGKLGEPVASPKVTLVDDGTARAMRGTTGYDDEGEETRWVTLVEGGILRGFLTDRLTAQALGAARTGSARRESYRRPPLPRMRNTFLLAGEDNPGEILSSTEFGLLAVRLGAGKVNQATGEFSFTVPEGYMIRDGKVAEPVRDAVLVGSGPEVLSTVDRVGSDIGYSSGSCGKEDQAVPVGDGMPTIRIPRLEVRRGTI